MVGRMQGVLPIPNNRQSVGLITYDAKEPDPAFPPIIQSARVEVHPTGDLLRRVANE